MYKSMIHILIILLALCAAVISCKSSRLREQKLGKLKITSGTVFVSDPSYLPDRANAIEVSGLPAGEFPVTITVLRDGGDQRVAKAVLLLSNDKPTSRKRLGNMGVDSGTGCMIDAESLKRYYKETGPDRIGMYGGPDHEKAARKVKQVLGLDYVYDSKLETSLLVAPVSEEMEQRITALLDQKENQVLSASLTILTNNTLDKLWRAMDKTYVDTYSTANMVLDQTSKANMIAFSTGYGDGAYDVYGCYKDRTLVRLELDMLDE